MKLDKDFFSMNNKLSVALMYIIIKCIFQVDIFLDIVKATDYSTHLG